MTIKQKIAKMIEEYSLADDNPTVLRELLKLSGIVDLLIKDVSNLDTLVRSLDLQAVKDLIDQLQKNVDDAVAQAVTALDAANAASEKTDDLSNQVAGIVVSITNINADISELRTSVATALSTSQSAVETANSAVDEVNTLSSKHNADIESINSQINVINVSLQETTRVAQDASNHATRNEEQMKDLFRDEATDEVHYYNLYEYRNTTNSAIAGKQDALTFDTAPTEGSNNPVTSDGIYKAIQAGGGSTIVLDDTVTETSSNGVKSSGIYEAIQTAQNTVQGNVNALQNTVNEQGATVSNLSKKVTASEDAITGLQEFQTTQEATNEVHNTQIAANKASVDKVTSDLSAFESSTNTKFDKKQDRLYPWGSGDEGKLSPYFLQADKFTWPGSDKPAHGSYQGNVLCAISAIYEFVNDFYHKEVEGKQDALTFDTAPTEGSNNPVTSDGIYKAIQAGGGSTIVFDDTVTETSSNGVKSSGIYEAIQTAQNTVQGNVNALQNTVTSMQGEINDHAADITALQADKMDNIDIDDAPTNNSNNLVKSGGVYTELSKKQPKLFGPSGGAVNTVLVQDLTAQPNGYQIPSAFAVWQALRSSGGVYDYWSLINTNLLKDADTNTWYVEMSNVNDVPMFVTYEFRDPNIFDIDCETILAPLFEGVIGVPWNKPIISEINNTGGGIPNLLIPTTRVWPELKTVNGSTRIYFNNTLPSYKTDPTIECNRLIYDLNLQRFSKSMIDVQKRVLSNVHVYGINKVGS